jgi:hypothetical protein
MIRAAALLLAATLVALAGASDHRDAPRTTDRRELDLSDLYVFTAPASANVTLILTVDPLVAPGTTPRLFDPKATYQFLIDTNANAKPDLTFSFRFKKPAADGTQAVKMAGTGFGRPLRANGRTGNVFAGARGVQLFAGLTDDPFFFDQSSSRNGFSFCGPDAADTFAGTNVGAIAIDVPRTFFPGSTLGVWAATRVGTRQVDRLGLPLINETVIGLPDKDRYNRLRPATDERKFGDLVTSRLQTLGNDAATSTALAGSLLPDLLLIDLDRPTGFPNGRRIEDDVADIELSLLLKKPTDCVDGNDQPLRSVFPYLAPPHVVGGTTTTTTIPAGVNGVLNVGYLHLAPGASIVCGSVGTTPALPGASATAGRNGPGGPVTTDFVLDPLGTGVFALPITAVDTYPITVTIQTGGTPIVLTGVVGVGAAQGTCPGPTGRALVLGANATAPFTAGDAVCLARVDPSLGACVGIGSECLSVLDPRLHLHQTLVVVGTPGGTFPDPNTMGCGHGLVVIGYPGCGLDTVPNC